MDGAVTGGGSAGGAPVRSAPMADDRLYFRQLLAGRDFAVDDGLARQMVNFAYVIGDRATGEALLVDPAYGVRELVEIAGADGLRVVGALATHYHPDHVGGSMMGYSIEGVAALLEAGVEAKVHYPVPVYRQEALEYLGYRHGDFPVSDRHALEMITFPVDQYLSKAHLDRVIDVVRSFYAA